MDRRTYLKTLGATGALVSVGLVVSRERSAAERPVNWNGQPTSISRFPTSTDEGTPSLRDRFDTVVDLRRRGADDTGTEPVDPLVAEYAADDTLLWFPPGRYRVDALRLEGLSNFGLVGDDATLVVGQPGRHAYLIFRRVADTVVAGLTADCTAENTAAWMDFRCVGGTNVIRDYAVEGFADVDERTNGFTLMVEGADTSLTVNADLSDGAKNGAATFVFPRKNFVDPSRRPGALTFRDCVMEGWGKEGLYASPHSGPLRVLGGEYANNAIDQIRVGGGNAPTTALVRGATVRIDDVPGYVPPDSRVFRGIWLEEGDLATVADCDLRIDPPSLGAVQAGIIVNEQFGRATIRDCRITTGVESPAVRVDRPLEDFDRDGVRMPSLDHLPPEWTVTCRNVSIEGTATDSQGVVLRGRDGCVFRDVSVVERGRDADGIRLVDADGCVVAGSSLVARRYPVVVAGTEPPTARCRLRLVDLARFESGVDGSDRRVAEGHERLARAVPAEPRVVTEYCLDGATVAELLDAEDRPLALALTRVSGGELYGRVVPFDALDVD